MDSARSPNPPKRQCGKKSGDAKAKVRKFWEELRPEINRIALDLSRSVDDELFVQSLEPTIPFAVHFAKVAIAIAEMSDKTAASELYKGFEHLLKGYYLPKGQGGIFSPLQFDFHKFLGHEFFVTFFST